MHELNQEIRTEERKDTHEDKYNFSLQNTEIAIRLDEKLHLLKSYYILIMVKPCKRRDYIMHR